MLVSQGEGSGFPVERTLKLDKKVLEAAISFRYWVLAIQNFNFIWGKYHRLHLVKSPRARRLQQGVMKRGAAYKCVLF